MSLAELDIAPTLGNDAPQQATEVDVELPHDIEMTGAIKAAVAAFKDIQQAPDQRETAPDQGLLRYAEHLETVTEQIAEQLGLNIDTAGADLEGLTAAVGMLSNMQCCEASLADLGNLSLVTAGDIKQQELETVLGA